MHEPNPINIILWLYRTMFKEITDLAYSVRVNCENSTYVSKSHSNTNYSNDKSLIVSLLKEQDSKVNASISLLAFPALNLEFNNINHAYLYLFLEDIKTITNKSTKLNIISDFDYIDIKNVNWNNYSGDSLSNKLSIEISVSQINSYIKFDVTDLINNLSKFDINYNLLISPITPSTSTFVKFSSCNSNNPPYLVLEKFEDDYSKLSTENTYDNATTSNDKNTYTKDITLDYENSYDDAKALSDEHTYNEKSNNYEITNDIIDNINLDSEDNIDTSNYINFKDNEYSTDSHLNIDFDYDSNDNNSNDLPPNNNNFNEIIEKIDNIYNILTNNITNIDEKLSRFDTQFINYNNILNELSDMVDNLNNKTEIINNSLSSSKYIIQDLSSIIKSINNKIDLLDNNFSSSNDILQDLTNIIKNLNNTANILDNSFSSSSNLINDLSNIIKNMNNKTDTPKKDVRSSDDKLSKLFDMVNHNSPILDFGNIISMMDTIKDTFGTSKSKAVTDTNNTIDDFSDIAKHISDKINQINDKTDSSDKKVEDSFQELSNSILNAINKNISLLSKDIIDSKNEVSDNE